MRLKTLVTGGAGFIGSAVVDALVKRGDEVRVFDNLSTGHRRNLPDGVEFIEGDIRDAHAVIRAVRGTDVVFHLAASVGNRRGIENPTNDASVNVLGTLNVLEAARLAGCRKIVYSSSAAIYGETKTIPVSVDHPKQPLTPYAVSKLAGENYVLSYNDIHGMQGVCLRYFNVYGERQRFDAYGNVLPIFVARALAGDELVVYGDGRQTRDFVNVLDVAAANLQAASSDSVRGAFNIGSGVATSINDVVVQLSHVVGTELRVINAPPRAGDVRDSCADVTSAATVLGYVPSVGLGMGLARYVSWLRADNEFR